MKKSKRFSAPESIARRRKTLLGLENIEQRLMLTGTGFVAGFATYADGTIDTKATISLIDTTGKATTRTATPNTDGYYQFNGVAPGTYNVFESETGYSTSSVSASTVVNTATAIKGGTGFQVTVIDPTTQTDKLTLNPDSYQAGATSFTLAGDPFNIFTQNGTQTNQLNFSIVGSPAASGNTASLVGVCTDLYDAVTVGSSYTVNPSLTPLPSALSSNVGQIGYLYNHYGTTTQSPAQGAGLQMAIWALLYNTPSSPGTPVSLTGPNLVVTSSTNPAILTAANAYLAQAVGKSEDAWFLNVTTPQTLQGGQGTIGTDLLNFTNSQVKTGSITGDIFIDGNDSGTAPSTPTTANGVGGILVTATPTGGGTPLTATTASNGTYTFPNVPAGTYSVSIGQPTNYLPGFESQNGTLIPGKAISTTPITTTVTAGGTTTDNFAELVPSTVSGFVYDDLTAAGVIKPADSSIATTLTLTGTNDLGQAVSLTTTSTTSTTAVPYTFGTLRPGTYTVTAAQPAGFNPGTNNVGTVSTATASSTTVGTVNGSNGIGGITLSPASTGINYNFGEIGSTISGTVYVDATGVGLTSGNLPQAGDTGEAGVTVNLYGNVNGSAAIIGTAVTGANGTYSFPGLPFGMYGVTESVPTGQYQTGPTSVYYVLTTTSAAPNSSNDNFSNYMQCSMTGLSGVTYTVTTPAGVTTTVNDLRGNTGSGDTVTANFTVAAGAAPLTLSLVAYQAPGSTYNSSTASQQVITSVVTGSYGPGTYHITVTEPNSYYQVDFVCGAPLPQLNGGAITYGSQGRLISADNGGTQAYGLSTIAGTVYVDANGNDTFDTTDKAVTTPVTLTLTGTTGTGTPVSVTQTFPTGVYSFTGLAQGTYTITETPVTGFNGELPTAGSVGGTSSFVTSTQIAAVSKINLNSNTVATSYNFGELGSTISGTVYVDALGGGLTATNQPQAGDTGEAGVTVQLTSASGAVIASTKTLADGTYSFAGVPFGTYGVQEVIPNGQYQTGPNSVKYSITTSATSPTSTNDNFANYMACSTAGLNNIQYFVNGVKVPTLSGHGLQGATVTVTFNVAAGSTPIQLSLADYESQFPYFTIYNVSQQVLVGDATGTFGPGDHSLTVTLPNSYFQVDFVCGAAIVQFGPGGSNVDYGEEGRFINGDIGGTNLPSPSSIAGNVYVDANGSDSFGSGDSVLATPVTLTLTGTTNLGAPVSVTQTFPTGAYSFGNLAPGVYNVIETPVSGYNGELPNAGTNGGTPSFSSTTQVGAINTINLNSNLTATGYNFGEFKPGTLSGTVFADNNGNGTFGTGDKGLSGVTVTLSGGTGAGVPVSVTTTTDANGNYSFTGIAPGLYQIAETTPAGYSPEAGNVGTAGGNSRVGIIDWIWDNSGTVGTGYNLGNSGSTISGTVYVDATGSGLTTANMIPAGSGDTGEAGVTVNLYNSSGQFVSSTKSAADGTYTFSGVPYGTYTINETVPTGQSQTGPNALSYGITTTAASPTSTNDNFSNYMQCSMAGLTVNSYSVYNPSSWNGWGWGSSTKTYNDLRGNTGSGDTVTVTFTIAQGAAPIQLSLVAYAAPTASYSSSNAYQQVLTADSTGTFGPGVHTLTVTEPNGYYQIDFVCGAALTQLELNGSKVNYNFENRLISADNGGCSVVTYCPAPIGVWQTDIGSATTGGTESYNNGKYTLTANNGDIWNNSDQENYVYQALNGDGELVTRVTGLTGSDAWAKAGIQIRQSLAANSAQASILVTPGNGIVFQDRETTGGNSNNWQASNNAGWSSSAWGTTSVYLKLVRSGTTVTAYDSSNGINWNQVGTDTISLSQQVYIGLVASSHSSSTTATANFDSVSTTGYWSSCSGQSLIQSFGGCSTSTSLSSWLASTYPNIYGSGAGCDNVWGLSNNGIASFCKSIQSQYGSESLECQTLSAALEEYATSWQLGGSCGQNYGFNVSSYGLAACSYNTAGCTDAFGTSSSNSWTNVWSLLSAENNQACGGILYAGNTARHASASNLIFCVNTNGC